MLTTLWTYTATSDCIINMNASAFASAIYNTLDIRINDKVYDFNESSSDSSSNANIGTNVRIIKHLSQGDIVTVKIQIGTTGTISWRLWSNLS